MLKAHLQGNGVPLLVRSLSVLVLATVSTMCVVGHGITDNIVRDGAVIDLVSLLHHSALPWILAGHEEGEGKNQDYWRYHVYDTEKQSPKVIVASVFPTPPW